MSGSWEQKLGQPAVESKRAQELLVSMAVVSNLYALGVVYSEAVADSANGAIPEKDLAFLRRETLSHAEILMKHYVADKDSATALEEYRSKILPKTLSERFSDYPELAIAVDTVVRERIDELRGETQV